MRKKKKKKKNANLPGFQIVLKLNVNSGANGFIVMCMVNIFLSACRLVIAKSV